MPSLVSIVGKKGSGKSEVLEELISQLTAKGLRVGVVKRLARDDIEIDEPGTDTYRYRMRGADRVVLAGRRRLAMFANLEGEIPIPKLVEFFEGYDLLFLEGYSHEGIPRIEIQDKEPVEIDELVKFAHETSLRAPRSGAKQSTSLEIASPRHSVAGLAKTAQTEAP